MNQHFHIPLIYTTCNGTCCAVFIVTSSCSSHEILVFLCPTILTPSILYFFAVACTFRFVFIPSLQIRTMKANYTIEAGDVRVIRPLVYVREKSTRDFSQESRLPIINENCPACFEQPKERDRVKKLLVQEESMIPNLFYNLKRALVPLMDDAVYDVMATVAAAADARGRNPQHRLPQRMMQSAASASASVSASAGAEEGEGEDAAGEESDADNKRKRPAPSGPGQGPGLFGSSSNLTNGKSNRAPADPATTATETSTETADDDDHAVKKAKNSALME
jgi:hypothetical protein